MSIFFAIDQWAAWAPGLTDQASWRKWLAAPQPITEDDVPKLAEMQPMMRRRVERLGRTALQAAYWCQESAAPCPMVFASRYGDMGRSVDLIRELATGSPVSPTSFSLAVHNAIGALYSIARGDVSPYSAVAAGAETVEAAFMEAIGLLAEGNPEVMVVYYDEPLPEIYKDFSETDNFPHAWACLLHRCKPGESGYSLKTGLPGHSKSDEGESFLNAGRPADLAVLEFLVSGRKTLQRQTGSRQWYWQRHA